MTIPCLELTTAVVAAKMGQKVTKELNMDLTAEYFWSDSQVVLAHINNDASHFHLFVTNRVQFIRENIHVEQWHYEPTKENPADHASRGMTVEKLISSNWFSGPSFLKTTEWKPPTGIKTNLMVGDPEIKGKMVGETKVKGRIEKETEAYLTAQLECINTKAENQDNDLLKRLAKYSSWELVLKIVARILRLTKGMPRDAPITLEERQKVEMRVLKLVQMESVNSEINALNAGNTIPSTSKLQPLDPKLEDGLIRMGGRLGKSTLSDVVKHPIILPTNSYLTKLLIDYLHVHHQGRRQTLNHVRSRGKAVERFLKSCVICRKLRRPAEQQKMTDLPKGESRTISTLLLCGNGLFLPLHNKGRVQRTQALWSTLYMSMFPCHSY